MDSRFDDTGYTTDHEATPAGGSLVLYKDDKRVAEVAIQFEGPDDTVPTVTVTEVVADTVKEILHILPD